MEKTVTSHATRFLNSPEGLAAATLISYLLMMLSIFGFWGAIFIHLCPICFFLYLRLKIKPIKERGLIHILPSSTRNLLLN
jgi:hypothetical protein